MTLADYLRQHNVRMAPEGHHHRTRSFQLQCDCPFCSPDSRKYRLGLSPRRASCWTCGYIPVVKAVATLTGQHQGAVRDALGDIPDAGPSAGPTRGRLVIPPGVGPLLPCHEEYLMGRGFDPADLVRLWGIQGIGMASRLAFRVWVPFHHDGEVVSWLTRGITPTAARHLSAKPEEEVLDHKSLLYGEDYCRHTVIVHEGYTDVWATGPGAVAICGIGYNRAQVLRLAQYPTRVVCFDNEPMAQQRASRLCRELGGFPGSTSNVRLAAKDAGEALVKCPWELEELRRRFLDGI